MTASISTAWPSSRALRSSRATSARLSRGGAAPLPTSSAGGEGDAGGQREQGGGAARHGRQAPSSTARTLVVSSWIENGLPISAHALVEHTVVSHDGRVVPRHEEHLDGGEARADAGGELLAVHVRHDDVGQQQVQSAFVTLQERQPRSAVLGGQHGIAVALEDADRHAQHRRGVLHHQHRFGAGGTGRRRGPPAARPRPPSSQADGS